MSPSQCPRCSSPLPIVAAFCPRCGYDLRAVQGRPMRRRWGLGRWLFWLILVGVLLMWLSSMGHRRTHYYYTPVPQRPSHW